MNGLARCDWANGSPLERRYHDEEWGVPLHDDRGLFEFLVLEGAQAGLSWSTILHKRDHYRVVYDGFDPAIVAGYGQHKIDQLLADTGIVRNRLKVTASVANARACLAVQAAHGSFADYVWAFVDGEPVRNHWARQADIPAATPVSERMSRELKRLGFRFVGPTICYAFMQAVGMVNDHVTGCFRHDQV